MITVIVPWDTVQLHPECEWQIWGALKGPLGIDHFIFVSDPQVLTNLAYDHVKTMDHAISLAQGELVFLDATGTKDVSEIPKTGDITIVVGSTNMSLIDHSTESQRYKIGQVSAGEMYGVNAAAIALAYRHAG